MIQWILFPLSIFLYVIWLLVCLGLALVSFVIPVRPQKIDLNQVKNKKTVCRHLNERGRLTDQEYNFETEQVAAHYDNLTLKGYLFIISPLLFFMKFIKKLEDLMLWLVYQWIKAHKKIFHRLKMPTFEGHLPHVPFYTTWITHTCVWLAQRVGVTISLMQSLFLFLPPFREER